jgi:hypothetical protein
VSLHDTFLDFQLWDARRRPPCRSRGGGSTPLLVHRTRQYGLLFRSKIRGRCTDTSVHSYAPAGRHAVQCGPRDAVGDELGELAPARILSNFRERPARVTRWSEAAVAIR